MLKSLAATNMKSLLLLFAVSSLLGLAVCQYEHPTSGYQQFSRSHLPIVKPEAVQMSQDGSLGLFLPSDVASRRGEVYEPNVKLGALTYPTSKNAEYGELNFVPHNPELAHHRLQGQDAVYYHPQQVQRMDRRYFTPQQQQELAEYEALYRPNGSPYDFYKGEVPPHRRTYQEAAINYQPQQRVHSLHNVRSNPDGNQYQVLYSHPSQYRTPTAADYQKRQYSLQEGSNSSPYPAPHGV